MNENIDPTVPYEFSQRGRRPIVFVALALGVFVMVMAVRDPDIGWPPWYFMIPAGLYFVGLFYLLIADQRSTLRLSNTALVLERGHHQTTWPLAEIEYVKITEWSDNTSVDVYLRNGQRQIIPDFCIPFRLDHLITALEARGVRIERG